MFWNKNDTEEKLGKKMDQMNLALKKSFENVKNDTTNIFQWLNYFYRKNSELEQTVYRLQTELSYMPKSREEIRKIIDDYYSFETLMARVRELNYKVDELSRQRIQVRPTQQPVEQKMEISRGTVQIPERIAADISTMEKRLQKLEERKFAMKERIIKKITKNSKEYVKSIILSYIKKYERISALQLKEMLVEEQQLCSKSSFYRLLEEIEQLEEIGVLKEGKEKHYLHKAVKHT